MTVLMQHDRCTPLFAVKLLLVIWATNVWYLAYIQDSRVVITEPIRELLFNCMFMP